ncbi:MAG: DUF6297 family protein [Propioniciclava sp.]
MSRKGGKHKRSQRSTTSAAAEPAVREIEPADFAGTDWNFAFLPDAEPEIVDEPALHGLIKQWRHGRATRTLGQALSDAYFALFSVVLLGAMVTNAIIGSQQASGLCDTAACEAGRGLVPWGVLLAVCALTAAVARLFGPVLASAAEGFWLLDAPLQRAPLLRPRLRAALIGAVLAGLIVGGVVAVLAGSHWSQVVAWASATGGAAGAVMAWGAVAQSHEHSRALRVGQAGFALGATAVLGVMALGSAAGWLRSPPTWWTVYAPWGVAAVGFLITLWVGLVAQRRLELFARARLVSGGTLVSGMQGAMFGLDFGLARDILVEREAAAHGQVRPSRGPGRGIAALVWRDGQRLLRFPKPLLGVLGATLVPYVSNLLGLGMITPLIGGIVLFLALIPTLTSLRVLSRTSGLARALPFGTRQLRMATAVVPAILALGCALLTAPAYVGWLGGVQRIAFDAAFTALAVAAAALVGAIRWQTAKPVNFQVPMMATGAGAVPPTLIFSVVRGFDMVVLITAPLLLGLDPLWALGIAVVVFAVLSSGMNAADMMAEAREQREELDAERSRAARRTTVSPAQRRKVPPARRRN